MTQLQNSHAGAAELPFVEFHHNLRFDFKGVAPIADVAESLIALERMLKRSPVFLAGLGGGVRPRSISVELATLQSGSLVEDIIVKVFFKNKKAMDKWLAKVGEKTGIQKAMTKSWVIPFFVTALVIGGGYELHRWATPAGAPPPSQTMTVNASNNTIIVLGADALGLTPVEAVKTVMKTVNKTRTATDVKSFVKPARAGTKGSLQFDGPSGGKIPAEFLNGLPQEAKPPVDEIEEEKQGVRFEIRALDLDNPTKWAAVVPSISSGRHPMEIAHGIDTASLMRGGEFTGHLIVHQRRKIGEKGHSVEVVRYELLSVKNEEDSE